jgi:uncharacterized membrane protein HdeD (DUF308 family)
VNFAVVSSVTRNTAPGCPGQHRHFGEHVKELKGRQKTHVDTGIRLLATTADGRGHTGHTFDEMRSAMNNLLEQKLWNWKLVAGLLTVVLGGLVLTWPGPTILVAATLFGVFLLLTGFTELFLAFTLPRSAATRILLFISGALSLILAVLSFRHFGDAYAVLLLSIWIGIGFIFQGVSEVAVSISEQNLPGRGWYAVLGIISVIAGLVVLVWPFDSIVVLALVTGIWLVVTGVVQIVQAFQIRKDAKTVREAVDSVSERFAPRQRSA